MTLSKVKSVQNNGSFENEYGAPNEQGKKLLYKFEYVFEDGIVMTANHKTTTSPFPVGSEVDYEITKEHAEHGKSGKVKKPDSGNFTRSNASNGKPMDNNVQLMIVRQSSLNRAVEVLCHNSAIAAKPNQVDELEVIELAERFVKWVMQPEKKEEVKPQSATSELMDEAKPVVEELNDDLPF